jgi:hypothetical protein
MLQNVAAWLSLGQMFYVCHISMTRVSGQKDVSFNAEKMFVFGKTFKLFGAEIRATEI